MIAALEARTRAAMEEDTASHLDYICEWLESGETLTELVKQLEKEAGLGEISLGMLRRHVMLMWPDADNRLSAARRVGAHAKVEQAQELIDDSGALTREELTHAKMKADVRLWSAERYNKAELGRADGITINVNHNELHLDSMRVRKLEQGMRLTEITAPGHARLITATMGVVGGADPGVTATREAVVDAEFEVG